MAKGTCLTCEHCLIGTQKVSLATNLPIDNGNGDIADIAFGEGYREVEVYTCTCLPMRVQVDRDYFCGQYVCDIARIQFQEEDEAEVVNLTTSENLPEV